MGYKDFFRNFDDYPDFQQKSRGDRNMNNTVTCFYLKFVAFSEYMNFKVCSLTFEAKEKKDLFPFSFVVHKDFASSAQVFSESF